MQAALKTETGPQHPTYQFASQETRWIWNPEDVDIGNMIGQGEFGEVMEIIRSPLQPSVAVEGLVLKRLRDGFTCKSTAEKDLIAECKFLSRFNHPNIVSLRATIREPGDKGFSLILERLSTTLDEKIQNEWMEQNTSNRERPRFARFNPRRRNINRALNYDRLATLYQVSKAMSYLHGKRIVFRDLKPSNVGFDSHGNVRLFDFGLAKELVGEKRVDIDAYRLTGATGSPRYMAPEVQLCLPYGKPADVYSFGILSWEVVSLQTPYAELNGQKLFTEVVNRRKRPPRGRMSWLSKRMQGLVQECWADTQGDRPTFKDVMVSLEEEARTNENCNGVFGSRVTPTRHNNDDVASILSGAGYTRAPSSCSSISEEVNWHLSELTS